MSISKLYSMQGMIFILMALGMFLKKIGVVDERGKKLLTDLTIYVTLPASIVRSFQIKFSPKIMKNCMETLVIAFIVQFILLVLGQILYRRKTGTRKRIMQYGTLCSNAGILGNAVAEGVFGQMGVLYASINLIPVRIFMWAVGLLYFTDAPSKKSLVKKVMSHPCIIAVILGLIFMITGFTFPDVIDRSVNALANANTAVSTIMVGTVLADIKWRELLDRDLLYLTFNRLVLAPAVIFTFCKLIGLSGILLGIPVIFANMPVAATTVILASKYDYDVAFASKCVVFTTLCSLFTTLIWCCIIISI